VLFAAFRADLSPVVELEEQAFEKTVPGLRGVRAARTKLFPRPPRRRGAKHFRFSLYRHNREYEARGIPRGNRGAPVEGCVCWSLRTDSYKKSLAANRFCSASRYLLTTTAEFAPTRWCQIARAQ